MKIDMKKVASYKAKLAKNGVAFVAQTVYAHYFRFLGFRTSAKKSVSGCWIVYQD